MKIKLYNQSGKPVSYENAKSYENDFKASYDVLWAAYEAKDITLDDFKEELAKVDSLLFKKYPMYEVVELPKSKKQWKNLQIKYGCSIVIAITQETKELVLFLMDSQYE
jgi:hypothetical protein